MGYHQHTQHTHQRTTKAIMKVAAILAVASVAAARFLPGRSPERSPYLPGPTQLTLIPQVSLMEQFYGSHYENPANGCQAGEISLQIQGVAGTICVPECGSGGSCPTDLPSGCTANPQCALRGPTGAQYCALLCDPSQAGQCGPATCQPIQGVGICTYV